MALLLLVSTTSWKVEKHYCLGHLVDVALFGDAEDCGMEMSSSQDSTEMSCCSDEVIAVDGQDDLNRNFEDFSLEDQFLLAALTYTYIDLYVGLAEQVVPHRTYPPPILVRDIHVLDQVFLI